MIYLLTFSLLFANQIGCSALQMWTSCLAYFEYITQCLVKMQQITTYTISLEHCSIEETKLDSNLWGPLNNCWPNVKNNRAMSVFQLSQTKDILRKKLT